MDWTLFQIGCLVVLAFAYGWILRAAPDRRATLATILLIALSAWAAEETSILAYRYYAYPDTWWLKLDEMPLIVTLIWPVVILSSRALVDALFPSLTPVKKALAVGLAVVVDASLVETIAVAASLWTWVEGGYLGAPLAGIIGWGAFAAAMVFALEHPKIPRWASPLIALGATHLAIIASWWMLFRHALRGELPSWSVAIAIALIAALGLWLLRRPRRIPMRLAPPRIAATSVFVVLLFMHATTELILHFVAVAALYLVTLDLPIGRHRRSS